ncbi:MAG TPA: CxxC-x17-CxxC domain-containing protein [Candidatus Thermoplasmatota archaeon]|jgi:CxxC-x17-CxxC domain-containing protein|nr:CxxC-x17-CxxC domain-containing protein [Candidatus Thermoplasmatota archaeon]
MFDTTCTRCGSATQVPFKPTPGRDVFCRDCFRSANPR